MVVGGEMKIFMEGLIIWVVPIMWCFLGADLAGQTSSLARNQ